MWFYAVMGKAEGSVAREEWHGHVTALSVAPEFRRLGLAAKLMEMLEEISERFEQSTFLYIIHVPWWVQAVQDVVSSCRKGGFFVDLFVRVSNQVAVNMYKRLGYSVYRTVIEYYSATNGEPDEDAYGESAQTVVFRFLLRRELIIKVLILSCTWFPLSCICQREQEGAL